MTTNLHTKGRRRSAPAVLPRERLVGLYLRCYADDEMFRDALDALYQAHRLALAELARCHVPLRSIHLEYGIPGASRRTLDSVAAIEAFAHAWRLNLFSEGRDTLCTFLMIRQTAWRETLVMDRDGSGGIRPTWRYDDGAPENTITARDFADFAPITLIPEPEVEWTEDRVCAVVRADGTPVGSFVPEAETVVAAKDRLRPFGGPAVDEAIERIASAWEQVGFSFPDAANRFPSHIQWLYRRVVYGEGCTEIARAANPEVDATTVRTPTDKYAKALGIPSIYLHARSQIVH